MKETTLIGCSGQQISARKRKRQREGQPLEAVAVVSMILLSLHSFFISPQCHLKLIAAYNNGVYTCKEVFPFMQVQNAQTCCSPAVVFTVWQRHRRCVLTLFSALVAASSLMSV